MKLTARPPQALDADSSAHICKNEWLEWLERQHDKKGRGSDKAWKWLRSFVDTIKTNLNITAKEEARAAAEWERLLQQADAVFTRIAKLPPSPDAAHQQQQQAAVQDSSPDSVSKGELIRAHGGHPASNNLFSQLDADRSGVVLRAEWTAFIETSYTAKEGEEGGRGRSWLLGMLHTLNVATTELENAAAKATAAAAEKAATAAATEKAATAAAAKAATAAAAKAATAAVEKAATAKQRRRGKSSGRKTSSKHETQVEQCENVGAWKIRKSPPCAATSSCLSIAPSSPLRYA